MRRGIKGGFTWPARERRHCPGIRTFRPAWRPGSLPVRPMVLHHGLTGGNVFPRLAGLTVLGPPARPQSGRVQATRPLCSACQTVFQHPMFRLLLLPALLYRSLSAHHTWCTVAGFRRHGDAGGGYALLLLQRRARRLHTGRGWPIGPACLDILVRYGGRAVIQVRLRRRVAGWRCVAPGRGILGSAAAPGLGQCGFRQLVATETVADLVASFCIGG